MSDRKFYSREAEMEVQREMTAVALISMLLGATIGAVLAILFAPSGTQEVRQRMADAMSDGYNRGRKAAQDALGSLETEYPNISEKISSILNRGEHHQREEDTYQRSYNTTNTPQY